MPISKPVEVTTAGEVKNLGCVEEIDDADINCVEYLNSMNNVQNLKEVARHRHGNKRRRLCADI